jgi:hypothetical protein
MPLINRALFFVGLTSFLLGLSGCFTEVGNPEDETQMTASFQMDYTSVSPDSSAFPLPDSVSILRFPVVLKSATYIDTDSTLVDLWQNPNGYPVDFTGMDPKAILPAQTLKSGAVLTNLAMTFSFQPQSGIASDTLNFSTFQNNGYVKGMYALPGAPSLEFLFALPDTLERLTLKYPQAALQGWRQNGNYHCVFSFLVLHWFSNINLAQATVDTDNVGRSIVLLDSKHNAGLYSALTARFYKSFNTQYAVDAPGSTP